MPNRTRISPWLCLLILPAFAAAGSFPGKARLAKHAAASASPQSTALANADVAGFWLLDLEFGLDARLTFENFFGSDGSWEGRIQAVEDEVPLRAHAFGTWKIRNDTIIVKTDPNRCVTQSEDVADCVDTSSSILIIRMAGGVKTLVDVDEGEENDVGDFVGAQRQFTIPALISASIFDVRGNGKDAARRSRVSISGNGSEVGEASGARIDLMGRVSGRRIAAGFGVVAPGPR